MKYKHSKAEQAFYEYMVKEHPDLEITKKGMPDFMILDKNKKIIGFVEVKRTELRDNLRIEQIYFKDYCKDKKISYQIWSSGVNKFKDNKLKEIWKQKTTQWEL